MHDNVPSSLQIVFCTMCTREELNKVNALNKRHLEHALARMYCSYEIHPALLKMQIRTSLLKDPPVSITGTREMLKSN